MNEAGKQPAMNLSVARVYLRHSDPMVSVRSWQNVLDEIIGLKTGPTQARWKSAAKDKAFAPLGVGLHLPPFARWQCGNRQVDFHRRPASGPLPARIILPSIILSIKAATCAGRWGERPREPSQIGNRKSEIGNSQRSSPVAPAFPTANVRADWRAHRGSQPRRSGHLLADTFCNGQPVATNKKGGPLRGRLSHKCFCQSANRPGGLPMQ
jgi:hypothetical protein